MAEEEPLFRREALEYHAGPRQEGSVLRLSPAWTRWAFWLLLGVVVFYGTFGVLARSSEYASGPAVVRAEDRMELGSPEAGRVVAVEVQPGQRVEKGQVLVRFIAGSGPADHSEWEPQAVRAPEAGVVSDVRVQPHQRVGAGDAMVTLTREGSPLEVIALLPGGYRPLLARGGPLRLTLQGFPRQSQELTIDEVADELMGPGEVGRVLGPGLAELVKVGGAVVWVRARLPSRTFEADGRRLTYFEGMLGIAQARVRSERLLQTVLPGAKALP